MSRCLSFHYLPVTKLHEPDATRSRSRAASRRMERRGVLWLLVGQCSALVPLFSGHRPVATVHRSPAILALQTDDEAQQEILALKAKLRAAEATIAELTSKARRPESHTEASSFEDSRFPLFRKAQSQAMAGWGKLWGENEDKLTTPPDTGRDQASDGHLAYLASEEQRMAAEEKASNASVEQIFQRYDADNSGQIDIDEFRQFLQDVSRGVIEAIPSLPEFDFSVEEEGRRFGEWSKETYGTAESMAYETAEKTAETLKGTAQSVVNAVQGLGAAAAASMPGAPAAVPLTLIGGVGSGYKDLLASGQSAQVPVLELITAISRHISPYLAIPRHTSPYLAISRHIAGARARAHHGHRASGDALDAAGRLHAAHRQARRGQHALGAPGVGEARPAAHRARAASGGGGRGRAGADAA